MEGEGEGEEKEGKAVTVDLTESRARACALSDLRESVGAGPKTESTCQYPIRPSV